MARALETASIGGRQRLVDWPLLVVTVSLCVVGLLTLYSAAGSPLLEGAPRAFTRQVVYMGLGLGLMVAAAAVPPRLYERCAYGALGVTLLLLLVVLLVGPVRGGAQRWLPLGAFSLQPSELAKLSLVLAAARYFAAQSRPQGWNLRDLLFPTAMLLLPTALLVFKGPDLGTTLFLCSVYGVMVFVVGLRWRSLLMLVLVAGLAAPLAYVHVLGDYQRDRVDALLSPDADPKGHGYQAIQGRYAIGSGRLLGKGFGNNTQGRLRFLPEQHTDFIFSVFAEERGYVGCVALLLLYFTYMLCGLWIAWHARDRFGALLCAGIVAVFFCHVCINLGGVLGLLPITGVTLPFMSYGGSSVLTMLVGSGMLWSVSVRGTA
tara:strand:+ start:1546 stop:2670 length:1125 start_codon:yes stop_codon:yes gene_type:complete